jgi:hypothetical protein
MRLNSISALLFGVLVSAGLGATDVAKAGDQVFRVDLNKTQIVRLPAQAGSIIVGNPQIADVSVHSQNMIFVVGRGFGETNLIILDPMGNTVMDADIQVTAVTPTHGLRVFNGGNRRTYSCAPYCQPSPILGDDTGFVGSNSGAEETSDGLNAIFSTLPAAGGDTFTGTPAPQGGFAPNDTGF